MKIILMAGFKEDNEQSIINMSNYIKSTYSVNNIYHATTDRCKYTLGVLTNILPDTQITPVKSLNVKYKLFSEKITLTDEDMWDRTDNYHALIKKMRNDTDEDLSRRLLSVYNNVLTQHLPQSLEHDKVDVVIIADQLAVSTIIEELYKINRYYSFRNIGCFISVINTKTKLLDIHKFYIPII